MNEILKTIHSLRSIHKNFSSREIRDEDLKLILDACIRAANASNRQSYSIVVVEDGNVMKKLSHLAGSKALIFCVDFNRIMDTAECLGHHYSIDDVTPFISGSTDTILAAQTAAIAAKSLGIDSLFTNRIHEGDITRVYELLGLPEKYCFPLIMLILGYPKEEPDHKTGRVCGPGIVHYGKYHRATTDELETLALQYDDPEKQMAVRPSWKDKSFKDWHYVGLANTIQKVALLNKNQVYEIMERTGFLTGFVKSTSAKD
jgi:nitroreductase